MTDPTRTRGGPAIRAEGLWVLASAIGLVLWRWGFQVGVGDHWVLMPHGMAWADPTAFARDWFDHAAPQPHWAFDVVNYVGEKLGLMAPVHFLYFSASVFAFVWACRILADLYFDGALWAPLLAVAIVVTGPVTAFGSTTPLLGWALPHMMGGCVFFLGTAALLAGRPWLAAACLGITYVAHVQHGAHFVLLTLVFMTLGRLDRAMRRARVPLLLVCGLLLFLVDYTAKKRGLGETGSDFVEICAQIIPYHCKASTWKASHLVQLFVVMLLPPLWWLRRQRWNWNLALVLGAPAAALLVGVWGDYFSMPGVSYLAERFNVFRWVTLLYGYTAMGFVALMASYLSFAGSGWRRCLPLALFVLAWQGWNDWVPVPFGHDIPIAISVWIETALVIWWIRRFQGHGALGLGVLFLILSLPFPVKSPLWRTLDLRQAAYAAQVQREVQAKLPADTLLLVDTNFGWAKFALRRGVVADDKSVPYGGRPYREWKQRIDDIQAFYASPVERFPSMREKYGFTHVLFKGKGPAALATWCPGHTRLPNGLPPYYFGPLTLFDCSKGASQISGPKGD